MGFHGQRRDEGSKPSSPGLPCHAAKRSVAPDADRRAARSLWATSSRDWPLVFAQRDSVAGQRRTEARNHRGSDDRRTLNVRNPGREKAACTSGHRRPTSCFTARSALIWQVAKRNVGSPAIASDHLPSGSLRISSSGWAAMRGPGSGRSAIWGRMIGLCIFPSLRPAAKGNRPKVRFIDHQTLRFYGFAGRNGNNCRNFPGWASPVFADLERFGVLDLLPASP